MSTVSFVKMIDAYLSENTLTKKTRTNYNVVRRKIEYYVNRSGLSMNLFDYDILAVQQHERRSRIVAFAQFWNGFMDYCREEKSLSVTTRRTYRQIFHAVLSYAENQYGVKVQMPKGESCIKWGDRKKELPMNVVEHLFSLKPSHHWAVNIVKLALYSCWRVSDLLALTADDIIEGDFMGQKCYYMCRLTKKTKKPMRTPVPIGLIRSIMRTNNVGPGEHLVKYPTLTRRNTYKKIDEKELTQQVRSLLNSNQFLRDTKITAVNVEGEFITKALYMVDKPMHLLRSAGISYLVQNGLTPQAIAQWFSGHESIKVLEDHYVTTSDFTGAKQLFRDRFVSTHLKQGDALQKYFDEEDDPQL